MDHLAGPSRHGGVFFDPIKAKSLIIWDVLQGHTMRMNNTQEAVYKPCQHTRAAQAGDGGCPTSRQSLSSLLMGGVRFGDGQPAKLSAPADSTQGAPGLTGLRDTVEDETVVASN
jgi:hypothetical protein